MRKLLPLLMLSSVSLAHAQVRDMMDISDSSPMREHMMTAELLAGKHAPEFKAPAQQTKEIRKTARLTSAATMQQIGEVNHDKLHYVIFGNDTEKVATLIGWVDSYDYYPNIKVPDIVPYNGEDVPVTTVNDYAFYGGWGITGLTLGKNVKTISTSAFYGCSITSVTIPSGLRYILNSTFANTQLKSITFEDASSVRTPLVLGQNIFLNTPLETFEVPARLYTDHQLSFAKAHNNFLWGTPNLREITVNPHFSDIKRNYTFEIINKALCSVSEDEELGGKRIRVIAYPAATVQKDFTLEAGYINIFDGAMTGNSLESINLKATSGIREGKVNLVIGTYAFFDSAISQLSLTANGPVTVHTLFAFYCKNLSEYTLSETITNIKVTDGVMYGKKDGAKHLISYPGGKRNKAFTIPADVAILDDNSFSANPYVEEMTLPENLTGIGTNAFLDCTKLRKITYTGSGITVIGKSAFAGTPFLTNAPDGPVMLSDCLIGYKGSVPAQLVLPDGMRCAPQYTFYGNQNIESVVLPSSMENIPKGLFSSCSRLQNVEWPENLKEIGVDAFSGTSINDVTLPPSCNNIRANAFKDCDKIQNIRIGDFSETAPANTGYHGVIGELAFAGTVNCKKVAIGKGFLIIQSGAFRNAGFNYAYAPEGEPYALEIPEGIEQIDEYAFAFTGNVNRLKLPSTLKYLGECSFMFEKSPAEVSIDRDTPPDALDGNPPTGITIFNSHTLNTATLIIPEGADPTGFRQYAAWNFQTIKNGSTGIEGIEATGQKIQINGRNIISTDDSDIELYRTDGTYLGRAREFRALAPGIYIIRSGSTTMKAAI